MSEHWRPVVDYEGIYEVSDKGKVRSLDREIAHQRYGTQRRRGIMLSPAKTAGGKLGVMLSDHHQSFRLVHQLVLEAFVGPCPEGMECCHANDIGTDNRLENLRWDSRQQNVLDQVRNGRHHKSRRTHCANDHEYTTENTRIRRSGARACRQCDRERHERTKWAS